MLIEELKAIVSLTSGKQREYFEAMLQSAHIVYCKPMSEVLPDNLLKHIKRLKIEKKQCYKNATLVAGLNDEIEHIDIDKYYNNMLNFIYTYSNVEGLTTTQQVEEAIEGVYYVIKQAVNYKTCGGYFQESFEKCYNELTDLVMYVVLNTEDMPNPEYKEEK